MSDELEQRRAAIDANQHIVAEVLQAMECEAALFLVPNHVAWFCNGFNARGLFADGERCCIYSNGKQRWLVACNVDTPRLFDDELDQLGFLLKEWNWQRGRAALIGELVTGKRIATDRPFPNMSLINDHLRVRVRSLNDTVQTRYRELGKRIVHALEATGRTLSQGETEEEVAGALAHRFLRHGVEISNISVTADGGLLQHRRSGFTSKAITKFVTVQATGCRDGLFVTASRTVCFGDIADELKKAYELAARLSAVWRSLTLPERSFGDFLDVSSQVLGGTEFEHELRLAPIGHGTGWHAAEELKRIGQDEPFVEHQALVQRAHIGPAAIVDTLLVGDAKSITPCERWPFKRIVLMEKNYDIPDLLKR